MKNELSSTRGIQKNALRNYIRGIPKTTLKARKGTKGGRRDSETARLESAGGCLGIVFREVDELQRKFILAPLIRPVLKK